MKEIFWLTLKCCFILGENLDLDISDRHNYEEGRAGCLLEKIGREIGLMRQGQLFYAAVVTSASIKTLPAHPGEVNVL